MMIAKYYVLIGGKTHVYHGPSCRCLHLHAGRYQVVSAPDPKLRACEYCGGK